jgi:hypothetical protein
MTAATTTSYLFTTEQALRFMALIAIAVLIGGSTVFAVLI